MKRTGQFLLYGATGFTGRLAARTAKARGLRPILAGRNQAKLRALADPLALPWRAFDLVDPAAIDAALATVDAVLHIAGPFSTTSKPMADACLRTGTHYLDITGEIDVFEALAARDAEAKRAGVMLLPGVGFDVVPSDCLALHLKQLLPDATDLTLSIAAGNGLSRGTAKTALGGIGTATRVRRSGRIVTLVGRPAATLCDFGQGPTPTVAISWGDVATAFHTTGILNIEVRMAAGLPLRIAARLPAFARRLAGRPSVQTLLKALIDHMPEGPSEEALRTGRSILIGQASNAKGETVRARLTTGQAYQLTAETSTEIARRVCAGEARPGFQTPSRVFGADFILEFEGTKRE